jgi:hypothetical protein
MDGSASDGEFNVADLAHPVTAAPNRGHVGTSQLIRSLKEWKSEPIMAGQ